MPHLARRFFGSLRPGGPRASVEAWAVEHLLAGERDLWQRMSGPDRRHAVGVALDVVAALGSAHVTRPVVAAALLHDVGKIDSGLRTPARVAATVIAAVRGPERTRAGSGRIARYLRHDEIGAALLHAAGSDPLTAAWAREHHQPPDRWTVPDRIAAALKAADGD